MQYLYNTPTNFLERLCKSSKMKRSLVEVRDVAIQTTPREEDDEKVISIGGKSHVLVNRGKNLLDKNCSIGAIPYVPSSAVATPATAKLQPSKTVSRGEERSPLSTKQVALGLPILRYMHSK